LYWGEPVSFTTNHSWWQVDYSLWDSIMAKLPGRLCSSRNRIAARIKSRRNRAPLARERSGSSGTKDCLVIHPRLGSNRVLWNTNSYMTQYNETPIGAVRTDATEKPEATLLSNFAAFSKALSPHLRNPQQPSIAIVTSQAAQFSVANARTALR